MIHPNSTLALKSSRATFSDREQLILDVLREFGPLTDREILAHTRLPEMNCIRPRVTEMVKAGVLYESDYLICPVTQKRVRVVAIVQRWQQGGLI